MDTGRINEGYEDGQEALPHLIADVEALLVIVAGMSLVVRSPVEVVAVVWSEKDELCANGNQYQWLVKNFPLTLRYGDEGYYEQT